MWCSKITSVACADARIAEARADTPSGAAEVYAACDATLEFLHFSHVVDEMGLESPSPFPLQIDNAAAIVLCQRHKRPLQVEAQLAH